MVQAWPTDSPYPFEAVERLPLFGTRVCLCAPLQKANHTEVNEAINSLLIEEEDFEGLKHSISTYDNFDQVRRGVARNRQIARGTSGLPWSHMSPALQRLKRLLLMQTITATILRWPTRPCG